MSKGQMTNFGIASYIHVNEENRANDSYLRGGRGSSISFKREGFQRLEDSFKSIVGMGSFEYLSEVNQEQQLMYDISSIFSSTDIAEAMSAFTEGDSSQKIKDLARDHKEILTVVDVAKTSALTTAYSVMKVGGKSKQGNLTLDETNRIYQETFKYASSMDSYHAIAKILGIDEGAESRRKGKEDTAAMLVLMEQISNQTEKVRTGMSEDTLFTGNFNFKLESMDKFVNEMNSLLERVKSKKLKGLDNIRKEANTIMANFNRQIKGTQMGEYASGVGVELFVAPMIEKTGRKVSQLAATGTQGRTVELEPLSGLSTLRKGRKGNYSLVELVDGITAEMVAKDQKADITLQIESTGVSTDASNVKVSRKTLNPLSSFAVSLGSNMSIGTIFAMLGDPGAANYFLKDPDTSARFFNALMSIFSDDEFDVLEENNVMKIKKVGTRKRMSAGKVAQAQYGDILIEFALIALEAMLSAHHTTFIDINGAVIPTPLYYEYMANKLLLSSRVTPASHLEFNRGAGSSIINQIMLDDQYDANLERNGYYDYASPAYFRNAELKKKLIETTGLVGVRGTMVSARELTSHFLR